VLARYAAGKGGKIPADQYKVHRNRIWRQAVKRRIAFDMKQAA